MTALDHDGRRRLAALQERYGVDRFREVEPCPGEDPESGLSLTIDAARRVIDVRVPDAGRLRTVEQLRSAVRTAFHEADQARDLASGDAAGERLPHSDRLDVTPLLSPSRSGPRDIVLRTRQAVASGVPGTVRSSFAGTGRSDNGYLTVMVGPTGVAEGVDADTEWLAAARPQFLQSALQEAFYAASTTEGDPR